MPELHQKTHFKAAQILGNDIPCLIIQLYIVHQCQQLINGLKYYRKVKLMFSPLLLSRLDKIIKKLYHQVSQNYSLLLLNQLLFDRIMKNKKVNLMSQF